MRSATRGVRLILLLLLLGLSHAALAQTPSDKTLTNEDVIKMVAARLSPSIILAAIDGGSIEFDLSTSGLISLKNAGVDDHIIEAMQAKARTGSRGTTNNATPTATRVGPPPPSRSEALAAANNPGAILRSFKTIFVDAHGARFFDNEQMKVALRATKEFAGMNITIVDRYEVADVVLDVGYTAAWDFPFTLKHRNTSVVLASGKGTGPFSGARGATSVAGELVKALKPYRAPSQQSPAPR